MRRLIILFLLLGQIHINIPESQELYSMRSVIDWYTTGGSTFATLASFKVGLSCVELMLISVCLMLVLVLRKRRHMNSRITKKINILKINYNEDLDVINGLGSSLECYRSRNSGLEMPLRKLERNCLALVENMETKHRETESQYREFCVQKHELEQGFVNMPVEININDLRMKVELATLKKYIDSEVSNLRMTSEYYSSLIDEAIDDVDRVFVAEGL